MLAVKHSRYMPAGDEPDFESGANETWGSYMERLIDLVTVTKHFMGFWRRRGGGLESDGTVVMDTEL